MAASTATQEGLAKPQGVPALDALDRDIARMHYSLRQMDGIAHPDTQREKLRIRAGMAASAAMLGVGGLLPLLNEANMATGESLAIAGTAGFVAVGLMTLHKTLQKLWVRPEAERTMTQLGQDQRTNMAVRDVLAKAIDHAGVKGWIGVREQAQEEHRQYARDSLGASGVESAASAEDPLSLDKARDLLSKTGLLPSAKQAIVSMSVSLHGKQAVEQILPAQMAKDPAIQRMLDKAYKDFDAAAWKVISGTLDATRKANAPLEDYLQAIEPFLRLSDSGSLPQSALQGIVLESHDRYGAPALEAIQESLMQGTLHSQEQYESVHPFVQRLMHPGQMALALEDTRQGAEKASAQDAERRVAMRFTPSSDEAPSAPSNPAMQPGLAPS